MRQLHAVVITLMMALLIHDSLAALINYVLGLYAGKVAMTTSHSDQPYVTGLAE